MRVGRVLRVGDVHDLGPGAGSVLSVDAVVDRPIIEVVAVRIQPNLGQGVGGRQLEPYPLPLVRRFCQIETASVRSNGRVLNHLRVPYAASPRREIRSTPYATRVVRARVVVAGTPLPAVRAVAVGLAGYGSGGGAVGCAKVVGGKGRREESIRRDSHRQRLRRRLLDAQRPPDAGGDVAHRTGEARADVAGADRRGVRVQRAPHARAAVGPAHRRRVCPRGTGLTHAAAVGTRGSRKGPRRAECARRGPYACGIASCAARDAGCDGSCSSGRRCSRRARDAQGAVDCIHACGTAFGYDAGDAQLRDVTSRGGAHQLLDLESERVVQGDGRRSHGAHVVGPSIGCIGLVAKDLPGRRPHLLAVEPVHLGPEGAGGVAGDLDGLGRHLKGEGDRGPVALVAIGGEIVRSHVDATRIEMGPGGRVQGPVGGGGPVKGVGTDRRVRIRALDGVHAVAKGLPRDGRGIAGERHRRHGARRQPGVGGKALRGVERTRRGSRVSCRTRSARARAQLARVSAQRARCAAARPCQRVRSRGALVGAGCVGGRALHVGIEAGRAVGTVGGTAYKRAHRHDRRGPNVRDKERRTHLPGLIADVVRRGAVGTGCNPSTKPAVGCQTPALDASIVQLRAGARVVALDVHDIAPRAHVHRGQRVAHLAGPVAPQHLVAISELSRVVLAPALDRVVAEDRARVVVAHADLLGGLPGAQVDGQQAGAHLPCTVTQVIGVPLAQLAGAVVAPALESVVAQDRARVVLPADNVLQRQPTDIDRRGRCDRVHGADAHHAVPVVAPALEGVVI